MIKVVTDTVSVAKAKREHDSHLGSHCRELAVDLAIYIAVTFLFHYTKCTKVQTCENSSILLGARIFFVSFNAILICCSCRLIQKIRISADGDAALEDESHVKKQLI